MFVASAHCTVHCMQYVLASLVHYSNPLYCATNLRFTSSNHDNVRYNEIRYVASVQYSEYSNSIMNYELLQELCT